MFYLRSMAAVLGFSLMAGELIRSWGQDRNLLFVADDFLIGFPLIVMALLTGKPSTVRFCGLTGSFALATGTLYGSFFGKLVNRSQTMHSNIDENILIALIGIAFASSLTGLIASLYFAGKYENEPGVIRPGTP